MKKALTLIVSLLILCLLTACGQMRGQDAETDKPPAEILEAVIGSQPDLPEMIRVTAGDEEFDTYLSNYYQLEPGQVADGALCYADGVEASELAVLRLTDEADSKAAEEALTAYVERRAGDFAGYAPQQEALAKSGTVVTNGKYVVLLICPDTSAAREAFLSCFGAAAPAEPASTASASAAPEVTPATSGSAPETNSPNTAASSAPETSANPDSPSDVPNSPTSESTPGSEPSAEPSAPENPAPPVESEQPTEPVQADPNYNPAAVLRAWSSGDTSALGEVNLSIYSAAKEVIDQNITSGMSDYEKELAIHDWITGWSSFSMSAFSHAPGGDEEYSVNTPYGVLINRSGTCWGYSSTFQLFMDMLGIECITVYGHPNASGVEHTWNQVKLDGEWYCVDTAWDDPIGGRPGHSYFNKTTEAFRRDGIHNWDETAVPEATGTRYSYGG